MVIEKDAPDQGSASDESLESIIAAEFDRQAEDGEGDDGDGDDHHDHQDDHHDEPVVNAAAAAQGVDDYNEPAPERWPADIRETYNSLPPAARKAMLDGVYKPMQAQYTKTTQELAEQRKKLAPMLATLERHAQEFQAAGINPVEAFERQMAWSAHYAKVGPEQYAKDLAKAYNLQAGQQQGDQAKPSDVYMTPVEKAQQARLDKLEQQLTTRERQELQRQREQQQYAFEQQQATVRETIASFANEMKDGQPLHPHVEKVSGAMAGLIRGGLVPRVDSTGRPTTYAEQLSHAYRMAVAMDDRLQAAVTTKQRQRQVDRVTAANRDVVSKTPGSSERVGDTRSLADSISELYDRMDRSAA
jgi:hypothetical protein